MQMKVVIQVVIFLLVLFSAILIFKRIGFEYHNKGKLSIFGTFLEFLIFALHGCMSYVFLDSNFSKVNTSTPWFILAILFIVIGFIGLIIAMSKLSWGISTGQHVTNLQKIGLYRYSRNPQIVTYFFVIFGYALLWPSVSGIVWVILYCLIGHIMVRTEEKHLLQIFGKEYQEYCTETPRYIGKKS
jgi:protein-S-isoprenylcysteine O-methyltransferase Ste14